MLATDNGAFTVEGRRDSMRHDVLHVSMFFFVIDSPFGGPAHNGARHAVREVLFDAGRNAEDFFFAAVTERNHAFEFRFRLGNVARKQEREPESDKAERHNSIGKAFGAALDRSLQVF